jgi:hypothetical protein
MTDSGLTWFAQQCLTNNVPLERYIKRAEHVGDLELANFLRRALHSAREICHPQSGQHTMDPGRARLGSP